MSNFLRISVRFLDLDPAFHGQRDGGEPEWPPSPLRLFQALVDAAGNRSRGSPFIDNATPALAWFQRFRPSEILAPAHYVGTPFRIAVPNNDLDVWAGPISQGSKPKKQPSELKSMKTVQPIWVRPSGSAEGDTLHYLYSLPVEGCHCLETLKAAARSITHLGWGIDMVAADADVISEADAANLPGHRWRVVPTGGVPLRVPKAGTLDDLIRKHAAFLGRLSKDGFKPVPPLSCFDVVGYRRAADPPPPRWAAFRLRHPVEDRAAVFSMTRANCVAAMTRNALARIAQEQGRDKDWIDRYVHGHRDKGSAVRPRFSYLPLPSIEQRADLGPVVGAIRRIVIAELTDLGESHLSWTRQMLPGQFLTDERTGHRRAMLVPLTGGDWVLRQYTAIDDIWATVTPVVLPGSDEGKFARGEKLFFKALRHAGYRPEALAELEFRNVSFWPAGELALRFHRPDYLKRGYWSVYHVRLRWKQEVKGPIALGAGRHCGLGIFAATTS
jgi:CRISPR-associated protein Csb2